MPSLDFCTQVTARAVSFHVAPLATDTLPKHAADVRVSCDWRLQGKISQYEIVIPQKIKKTFARAQEKEA